MAEEWVDIKYDGIDGVAKVTLSSFNNLYKAKGWRLAISEKDFICRHSSVCKGHGYFCRGTNSGDCNIGYSEISHRPCSSNAKAYRGDKPHTSKQYNHMRVTYSPRSAVELLQGQVDNTHW